MNFISTILDEKGHEVVKVSPDATVYDALQLMADHDIGALVVEENGKVAGMFTERDYARQVILKGRSSKEMKVRELMVKRLYYVTRKQTITDCMVLMTEKKIRHLPVIEDDKLLGIVSIGDVVNMIIHEQRKTIRDMENYITGGYGNNS
ncbi:MAG TPA: CBS domain-containing protein [Bacteroidales bacterium]|nr:CBS domain-containing protein [Bacteroidales bacterium]